MKAASTSLLGLYLLILLWIVLFKFSVDFSTVLLDHQTRSLNLIPFAFTSRSEMISNVVAFIPFGLLLDVRLKLTDFRRKLAAVFFFSVAVEIIQYLLAIGATDITDVIMNTLGGLLGLLLYRISHKHIGSGKLDWFIITVLTALLILLLLLRFLVLKVRY